MDNRKLSARADAGGTTPTTQSKGYVAFLDKTVDLAKANWEVIFYIGLMIVMVLTRLMELGPRALHHDESIHAYYSNLYSKGGGYTYDPTYHGPFLYHATGLALWLFGSTDAMTRIAPAFFGIILIAMCWFLRPFIGRVGAIIAVLMLTISPSIAYYSRSLRHDIFALTGTMVLFICILWFLRTHQAKWVYIGALAFAIAFTSHELMYIVGLVFVLFLVLAAFLFPALSRRSYYGARTLRGDEEVNPVTSGLRSLGRQKWTLVGGILIFFGFFTLMYSNMLTKFAYPSETFRPKDANGVPTGAAPTLPYFTSLIEGAAYWLTQHDVQRGNQPNWYYAMLMIIYEPLALLAGLGALVYTIIKGIVGGPDRYAASDEADAETGPTDEYGVALPSIYAMRGFTMAFLVFWSLGGMVAFSIAGERLPWLVMQAVLPFTLLAAAGLGRLFTSVQWRETLRAGGAFLGIAVLLLLFSGFAFIKFLGGPKAGDQWVVLLQGVLLFAFTIGLLALIAWLAYRMMLSDDGEIHLGRPFAVVGVTFVIVLALYGIRSTSLVNFRHGDVPIEMLVYTQSAPDVPLVADRVKRLSRDETAFDQGRSATDVTGGRSLQIGIDSDVEWPFDWYFRDMKAINYYPSDPNASNYYDWSQPQTGPLPPVLITNDQTITKQGFIDATKDKYASQKFVLRWWFPEELYKTDNVGDLGKAVKWMTNGFADSGQSFIRYLLYRDPGMPLGSTDFYLHVRNDLAAKVGMPGTDLAVTEPITDTTSPPPPVDDGSEPVTMFANWGSPPSAGKGKFNLPRGIAQDANGNFFVVDTANYRVQKFDSAGNFVAQVGTKGTGNGQFNPINEESSDTGASGVAVDKNGNVYVADVWNHRIQKFDNDLKFLKTWGSFINLADDGAAGDSGKNIKFYGPRGLAIGPDGNLYVTDTGNKRVMVYNTEGQFVRSIDSGMSPSKKVPEYTFNKPGEMNEPIGVAVDKSGNVYVADTNNHRVQKFDSAGKFVTQWAIPGGGWDPGVYMEPFIALDSAGNLYVSAPTSKTILKYDPNGQLMAQKNKQNAVILKTPTGLVVGADGKVYVSDAVGHGVVDLGTIP